MRYSITIKGTTPLIMHNGAAGLDVRSPANIEKSQIAKKKGTNRAIADDIRLRELETETSLWLNADNQPTVPEAALRAVIETGARKLKQGPQVREGLVVERVDEFIYDRSLGTTVEELVKTVQFVAPVVVQRARILRTRAKFDDWSVRFTIEVDDELVDQGQLERWLDIGGRRIGLGDWRPEKSGHYGRFEITFIESIDNINKMVTGMDPAMKRALESTPG